MNLPDKVRSGEPVTAESYNALIDALRAITVMPGVGYTRRVTSGGTVLSIRRPPRSQNTTDHPPFAVRLAEKDDVSGEWEIELEPGRVRCANPVQAANEGDGWDYFVPEINGTPMDERDVDGNLPRISVAVGDWIYCKIRRDAEGLVDETPTMVAQGPDEHSIHYQPPNPLDSGVEETHQYARICGITEDVDGNLVVEVFRESDIDLVAQLWAGENIGLGADPFKQHKRTTGRWQFRRTNGNFGTDATTNGDQIDVDFDGENLTDLGGGLSGDVYKEPTPAEIAAGGPAQFRPITQGPSGRRQIEINQTATAVQVYGNGVDGSLTLQDCSGTTIVQINWEDGLITTPLNATIQIPDCAYPT